jgi:transcriptional regulator with GAF, ATPase, and Fis domain
MTTDDHLRQTLAALTDHLRDSVTQEIQNVATTITAWQDVRIAALVDANARLRESIRAIDRARTLTGILGALMDAATSEASRVAIVLVRDGRLQVWRSAGFASNAQHPLDLFDDDTDASCACVPLTLRGEVVGLLYADRSDAAPDAVAVWPAIEMLARHASRALEAVTAFRTAQVLARTEVRSEKERVR